MARARPSKRDPKEEALARDGVLNPRPEAVRDPLFVDNPFFDTRDLVQVRYELVPRHQADGQSIRDAADVFGVSTPTLYQDPERFGRPRPRWIASAAARAQGRAQ